MKKSDLKYLNRIQEHILQMPVTKANYKLPDWGKKEDTHECDKNELERKEFEEAAMVERGAKGSFMIFREKGLEDVFVVDEL